MKIFIVAGTYQQGVYFMQQNAIPKGKASIISDIIYLRGISDAYIVLVGTYWENWIYRRHRNELDYLRDSHNCKVVTATEFERLLNELGREEILNV